MYQEWIEVLQTTPLFRGIDREGLSKMLECLKPRIKRYKYREIVALYGSPLSGIGIVASGKVALTRETYSGNRIMLGILDSGDIFGETAAFSNDRTWPVTVIANEDCQLLFLPPDKIQGNCSNICIAHSILILNMLNILSNKALMLNKKIEYLSAKSIRGKVSSYLLEEYVQNNETAFRIPMKRHELADYLGIPRPSLSREMIMMKKDGIIDYDGSWVQINDILKLERSIG
ncbi:MAG: Crp/Fnr family transcriptional regulator [Dehalococcoidales bacterium]|nr:Crp/Fnr family transcriptional regulator [Dehalococcoidales bacterium]